MRSRCSYPDTRTHGPGPGPRTRTKRGAARARAYNVDIVLLLLQCSFVPGCPACSALPYTVRPSLVVHFCFGYPRPPIYVDCYLFCSQYIEAGAGPSFQYFAARPATCQLLASGMGQQRGTISNYSKNSYSFSIGRLMGKL